MTKCTTKKIVKTIIYGTFWAIRRELCPIKSELTITSVGVEAS
jgi:hypothetical protein